MSTLSGSSSSRREFLRDVAIASAAMAGGVGFPASATAEPGGSDAPIAKRATKLDLGLAPDANAAGAVVVLTEWGDFVTFRAMVPDNSGVEWPAGTAVIALTGCVAKTFSYSTADEQGECPRFYSELDSGAIFELRDSEWLAQVKKDWAWLESSKRKPLRHFIFTFNATTFQCVAEGLVSEIRTEPFGTIAADLARQGLGD